MFWLGLVGLLLFYAKLGWVEGPGRLDVAYDDIVPTVTGLITIDSLIAGESEVFWNALSHLVLPASILGYLSLAYVARMTRSFMLGQLGRNTCWQRWPRDCRRAAWSGSTRSAMSGCSSSPSSR